MWRLLIVINWKQIVYIVGPVVLNKIKLMWLTICHSPPPPLPSVQMAALWDVCWSLYGCLFQDSLKYYRISGQSVQEICEYNVKVGKPDLLRTSVPWGDIYISPFLFKLLLRRFYSICLLFESPLYISIACKGKWMLLSFIRYIVWNSTTYFEVKMAPSILCIGSWWCTSNL
jgi:hypothetical protein